MWKVIGTKKDKKNKKGKIKKGGQILRWVKKFIPDTIPEKKTKPSLKKK